MEILDYDEERDFEAVHRIWIECGWIGSDLDKGETEAFRGFIRVNDCIVLPVHGRAECAVMSTPGQIRHGETDLELGVVAAVTTSHVARRVGAAAKLTSETLARQAESGAAVSALGMFEQGFYNRLGFGTGAYVNHFRFDPATLAVPKMTRPPVRVGPSRWRDVHGAMMSRRRGHGGVTLTTAQRLEIEMMPDKEWFGLGYEDGPGGSLSHFFWGEARDEHGPYRITFMAWQNDEQLFELLSTIAALGDQVSTVEMEEPPEIQFQDLLKQPFRNRGLTLRSKHESYQSADAWWQLRMLDVAKCLEGTRLEAETLRFNLSLTDPVEGFLGSRQGWRGTAGDYTITLGESSAAEQGHTPGLPALEASVGAFSRLWMGVRPASSLSLTDELAGEEGLLRSLDRTLRLPTPFVGWDF